MEYELENQRKEILYLFEEYLVSNNSKNHSIRGFSKHINKTSSHIYSFFKNSEELYHELYVLRIENFDNNLEIVSFSPINEIILFTIKLIEGMFSNKNICRAIPTDIQYAHLRKYLYEKYYIMITNVKENTNIKVKADQETITNLLVYLFIGFITLNSSLEKDEAIVLIKKSLMNFITTYFK